MTEFLLTIVALTLLIPTLVVFLQVVFAYLPSRRPPLLASTTRIAVLVPAHDEAIGIATTIGSILSQIQSKDRLIVVADNCSDNTAQIAIENGAEVVERHDSKNRGKGFALDFGIQFIAQNPPDVLVIIDADCYMQDNSLSKLVAYSMQTGRPVQCLDLMIAPEGTSLKGKLAEFAWIVRNHVRPLGFARIGLPCQLMGTGMAFPWQLIKDMNLANGNIVEDMKLGMDLSKIGKAPIFYENALVTSFFPSSSKAQSVQRARWEHGHMNMILSELPRLAWFGLTKGNKDVLAIAADLCVPPLALFVAIQTGLFMISIFLYVMGIAHLPLYISLLALFTLTVSILLAWWGWARSVITPIALFLIPIYVLSKIPHYLMFLFNRERHWVRTDRNK